MRINKKGFWENDNAEGHAYDGRLAYAIVKLLRERSIANLVDFGCGTGSYVRFFSKYRIYTEAFDGNPNTPKLSMGFGQVQDLSQPFDLKTKYKCVMSLEVGEHIPAEFEQTFLDNLVKHIMPGGIVILSWAIPGQSGDGHVNCQSNQYIREQMKARGYIIDQEATKRLRNASRLWWFKNSLMVFI